MAAEPSPWSATAAIATCRVIAWSGDVWRCHSNRYPGDSAAGSLKATGRYDRGSDKYPTQETWPALYTALAQHVALGERIRHTTPAVLPTLAAQRISRLRVTLQRVLRACSPNGCHELAVSGLTNDDICRPADYSRTHALAEAARQRAEAFLIPSCTRFPEGNLIIFTDRLQPRSEIRVIDSVDPDLIVDWSSIG
jgi:hypothetical protein